MPFAFHNQQGHASKTDSLETPNEVHFRDREFKDWNCMYSIWREYVFRDLKLCPLWRGYPYFRGCLLQGYMCIICTYSHTSSMVLLANGLLPSDHISYIVIP